MVPNFWPVVTSQARSSFSIDPFAVNDQSDANRTSRVIARWNSVPTGIESGNLKITARNQPVVDRGSRLWRSRNFVASLQWNESRANEDESIM